MCSSDLQKHGVRRLPDNPDYFPYHAEYGVAEIAQTQAGAPFSEYLLPVNEENIKQKVDCSPSENELALWQR